MPNSPEDSAREVLDTFCKDVFDAFPSTAKADACISEISEALGSVAFPSAGQATREIRTDLELKRCPSCDAGNVFLVHSVRSLDARRHVECRICDMRGPIRTEDESAVDAWNKLPRTDPDREALTKPATKLDAIASRVEASMCITYGSEHPDGRKEARITAEDWASIMGMLRSPPEPVYKAVERILDDHSAWISRPNHEVTERIALAATIAAHVALTPEGGVH